MRRPALADKSKNVRGQAGRHKRAARPIPIKPRVQQFADTPRHEAIGVEKILFHGERGITSLQIAGPIVRDAMAKDQILSAGRRTNGIRLDELDLPDRARERARRVRRDVHGLPAQLLKRQGRHGWRRRECVPPETSARLSPVIEPTQGASGFAGR